MIVDSLVCIISNLAVALYLKNYFVCSKMTTVEVIQTLLDKYMITNSSNKFALYEKTADNLDESR